MWAARRGGAGGRGLREKPIALTSVRAVAMNLGAARREQSLVNGSPTRCIAAHSCDASVGFIGITCPYPHIGCLCYTSYFISKVYISYLS